MFNKMDILLSPIADVSAWGKLRCGALQRLRVATD